MAAQILTSFTPQLVVALCNIVQEVSDHCLSKQLIGNEVRKRILESTTTSEEQVRTLLTAVKDAVATDQTLFKVMMEILRNVAFSAQEGRRVPPFIQEMEEQYQKCMLQSQQSRKRKRRNSEPTLELSARSKFRKLTTSNIPEIVPVASKAKIIEMHTPQLVSAISSYVEAVCDRCLACGLMHGETYRKLCETTNKSKADKTRILLQEIIENTRNDNRCLGLFLQILTKSLPTTISGKLVPEIEENHEKVASTPLVNISSPQYQAIEASDSASSTDIHSKFQEATVRLAKANHDKERLEEELALKIEENAKLKEELNKIKAEGHENKNKERIEHFKMMIAEREQEIIYLQKRVKEKEKEVEDCHMRMKREREMFQEENSAAADLHREARKLEAEMRENLRLRYQKIEREIEKVQQTKDKYMERNIKLKSENDDLHAKNSTLSGRNSSLQSQLDIMKREHSSCIKRSVYNPCYCDRIDRKYCPKEHYRDSERGECRIS